MSTINVSVEPLEPRAMLTVSPITLGQPIVELPLTRWVTVQGVAVDRQGNLVGAATVERSTDLDPSADGQAMAGGHDNVSLVVEYTAAGGFRWVAALADASNGNAMAQVTAVTTDAGGNVYAVGRFYGTIDFDPSAGGQALRSSTGPGSGSGFLWKLTPGGALASVTVVDLVGLRSEWPEAVAVDDDGNAYVAGTGDSSPSANFPLASPFACRIDAGGGVAWHRRLPGGGYGTAVGLDADRNVYALAGHGPGGLYLSKFTATGQAVWRESAGDGDTEIGGLAVSPDGDLYVTGAIRTPTDFRPGPRRQFVLSPTPIPGADNADAFLARYDADGRFVFARQVGGRGRDFGLGVALADDGSVMMRGLFDRAFDADASAHGRAMLQPRPRFHNNQFILRFDAAGRTIGAARLAAGQGQIFAALALTPTGKAAVFAFTAPTDTFTNADDPTRKLLIFVEP